MTRFFALKLAIGALIAAIVYAICTGATLLALTLTGTGPGSADPVFVILAFGFVAALLVTGTFLINYTAPNLAWLITLRTSKAKIWTLNYATSFAIIALVSFAYFLAAWTIERVYPVTALVGGSWTNFGASLAAVPRLLVAPHDVSPGKCFAGVLFLGLAHFCSGMLDMRPGRAARYTVLGLLIWGSLITLVGLASKSGMATLAATVTAGIWFQARHTRARLDLSWRHCGRIYAVLAAAWGALAAGPLIGTVRALESDKIEIVRDASHELGKLAQADPDHIARLLHQPAATAWEFEWGVGHAFPSGRLEITDPRIDFDAILARQTRGDVIAAIGAQLSPDATVADLEKVIARSEGLPDSFSEGLEDETGLNLFWETRFAGTAIELSDVSLSIDRLLQSTGTRARTVGVILARYFPSPTRLKAANEMARTLSGTAATEAKLTARLLTLSNDCVDVTAQEVCKIAAECAYRQSICMIRKLGGEERLNACIRSVVARERDAVDSLERIGWIDGERDDVDAAKLVERALRCPESESDRD